MEKSENNNMINVIEVLGLEMGTQKKRSFPFLWLLLLFAFMLAAAGTGLFLLRQESKTVFVTEVDFTPYLQNAGPQAIVEARFRGQQIQAYDYEVLGYGEDLINVHTETRIDSFDVLEVYYGRGIAKGDFQIETSYDCGFLEGETYLLFVYKGEAYVTDFYDMEETIPKTSPYYILESSLPLIRRKDDDSYLLADGSAVSESVLRQELNGLIESIMAGPNP